MFQPKFIPTSPVLQALPFLMIIAAKAIFAPTADALKSRGRLSHTTVSKGFNSIGEDRIRNPIPERLIKLSNSFGRSDSKIPDLKHFDQCAFD